jgi:hypothetical protein
MIAIAGAILVNFEFGLLYSVCTYLGNQSVFKLGNIHSGIDVIIHRYVFIDSKKTECLARILMIWFIFNYLLSGGNFMPWNLQAGYIYKRYCVTWAMISFPLP